VRIVALGSGTSQGVPVIGCKCEACLSDNPRDKRLRTSIYIEVDDIKIQIDVGPDFRAQFLNNNLETLDHVLITHEHNDHVIGIDDLRAINFIQRKSIPIYAEERVLESIKQRFHYAFAMNKYPGVPQIDLVEINTNPFRIGEVLIEPIRIIHGRLPILGFKIQNLVYITDASEIEEEQMAKIKNIDTLIINALRLEKHYSHYTLSECLEVIEQINPRQAFITHISHKMGPMSKWAQGLPSNVQPLCDKMIINI